MALVSLESLDLACAGSFETLCSGSLGLHFRHSFFLLVLHTHADLSGLSRRSSPEILSPVATCSCLVFASPAVLNMRQGKDAVRKHVRIPFLLSEFRSLRPQSSESFYLNCSSKTENRLLPFTADQPLNNTARSSAEADAVPACPSTGHSHGPARFSAFQLKTLSWICLQPSVPSLRRHSQRAHSQNP